MTDIHNSANRTQAYCSPLDDVLMIHVVENVGNKFCWKYAHAACCDARQLCHTKGCIVTWLGPSNQFRSHVTYIFSLTPSLQLLFSSNFWCAKGGTPCGGLLTPCYSMYDQFSPRLFRCTKESFRGTQWQSTLQLCTYNSVPDIRPTHARLCYASHSITIVPCIQKWVKRSGNIGGASMYCNSFSRITTLHLSCHPSIMILATYEIIAK